jgi:hypothetical protein
MDEASATVAKDALHNYKLDGENKIKVSINPIYYRKNPISNGGDCLDHLCKEIIIYLVVIVLVVPSFLQTLPFMDESHALPDASYGFVTYDKSRPGLPLLFPGHCQSMLP